MQGALDTLRGLLPTWAVDPYASYSELRRQQREAAAVAVQEQRQQARRNGNKRPRVEAGPAAASGGSDAEGWMQRRCSVM